MRLIGIGGNNVVADDKIVIIASPSSAQTKRAMEQAKDKNKLWDLTSAKPTRSVVITTTGVVIKSAVSVETLTKRVNGMTAEGQEE